MLDQPRPGRPDADETLLTNVMRAAARSEERYVRANLTEAVLLLQSERAAAAGADLLTSQLDRAQTSRTFLLMAEFAATLDRFRTAPSFKRLVANQLRQQKDNSSAETAAKLLSDKSFVRWAATWRVGGPTGRLAWQGPLLIWFWVALLCVLIWIAARSLPLPPVRLEANDLIQATLTLSALAIAAGVLAHICSVSLPDTWSLRALDCVAAGVCAALPLLLLRYLANIMQLDAARDLQFMGSHMGWLALGLVGGAGMAARLLEHVLNPRFGGEVARAARCAGSPVTAGIAVIAVLLVRHPGFSLEELGLAFACLLTVVPGVALLWRPTVVPLGTPRTTTRAQAALVLVPAAGLATLLFGLQTAIHRQSGGSIAVKEGSEARHLAVGTAYALTTDGPERWRVQVRTESGFIPSWLGDDQQEVQTPAPRVRPAAPRTGPSARNEQGRRDDKTQVVSAVQQDQPRRLCVAPEGEPWRCGQSKTFDAGATWLLPWATLRARAEPNVSFEIRKLVQRMLVSTKSLSAVLRQGDRIEVRNDTKQDQYVLAWLPEADAGPLRLFVQDPSAPRRGTPQRAASEDFTTGESSNYVQVAVPMSQTVAICTNQQCADDLTPTQVQAPVRVRVMANAVSAAAPEEAKQVDSPHSWDANVPGSYTTSLRRLPHSSTFSVAKGLVWVFASAQTVSNSRDDTVVTLWKGSTRIARGDQDDPDRVSAVLGPGDYTVCVLSNAADSTGTAASECGGAAPAPDQPVEFKIRFSPIPG